MSTAILLHGAWHGGWSWDLVAAVLREPPGWATVAPDLPAGDGGAGLTAYAQVAVEALDASDGEQSPNGGARGDGIVVVGHSLGALVAPVVAERLLAAGRRVTALVLVCPLCPEPGVSARDQARAEPGIYTAAYRTAALVRHADGSTSMPADVASDLIYDDCPAGPAAAALARMRPQHWKVFFEPSPLVAWHRVETRIVAAEGDRLLGRPGVEAAARRLGIDLTWLPGGHAPMLTRPEDVAINIRGG